MTTPTPPLFDPPPKYVLPLSKGGDLSVDFRNNPSGDGETFVDYADGTTVTLIIDLETPIEQPADVDGHHAYVTVESTVADTIPKDVLWRAVVTVGTTETVAANGKTKRFDGA